MTASFSITSPFGDIQQRIQAAKLASSQQQPEILQVLGVTMLGFAQLDYRTLSRGGTASDGRRWKALDPKTIARKAARGRSATSKKKTTKSGKVLPVGDVSAIGIDTGLQIASGSPGFTAPGGGNIFMISGSTVVVGYGRSYSKYFDETRPLLPDKLPPLWRTALEGAVGRWIQKIVSGTILKE